MRGVTTDIAMIMPQYEKLKLREEPEL